MSSENIKKHLWGMEIIWADGPDYKGKILVFEKENYSTHMHMHKESSKSWFVNSGEILVRWIDTNNGQTLEQKLNEGETIDIKEYTPVMAQALTAGASMSEVSNQKEDDIIILAQTMKVEENVKEPV